MLVDCVSTIRLFFFTDHITSFLSLNMTARQSEPNVKAEFMHAFLLRRFIHPDKIHVIIIILKEHFRECLVCNYTNMSLFGQCTDSDGCAVDRAKAWCEMIDTIYYRSVYKKNTQCFCPCLFSFTAPIYSTFKHKFTGFPTHFVCQKCLSCQHLFLCSILLLSHCRIRNKSLSSLPFFAD